MDRSSMSQTTDHSQVERLYDGYVFDIDGTVTLGDALLPTAGETIRRLRALGRRTVFLSNNPTHSRRDYADRLTHLGLSTAASDIVHSSLILVTFLQRRMPGATLFVAGEAPLEQELLGAGFRLSTTAHDIDAVIASFDRHFAYWKLQVAFDAIRRGARFFATNGDRYCPVPGGGEPDAASVIAAIEACTGKRCEAIVGKPSVFAAEAILDSLGLPADRCLMTGDRLETDVVLGLNAGMGAALVLTGATDEAALAASPIRPTHVLRTLSDLLPQV